MRLFIHGIGGLAMGRDEPYAPGTGALREIPIADYAGANHRRRFGRLAKLFYVAACRAVERAGVEDIETLAIVGATAVGETSVSLEIITQIRASRGVTVSPRLVPNSVHNSPAGYFSIGRKNHQPSVTVSQGWLSGEAGLMAASDLLALDLADRVLVILGDEADPEWARRLEQAGAADWAGALQAESFQEGAVAVVAGREPGGLGLGSVSAGVVRSDLGPADIAALLEKHQVRLGPAAEVRVRQAALGARLKDAAAEALGLPREAVRLDGAGLGTSQAAAFLCLEQAIAEAGCPELLLLGAERDELAFLHWVR